MAALGENMRASLRSWVASVSVVLSVAAAAHVASAQGVTGAAVTGTITGEGVGALEAAEVQLRNTATGEIFTAVTGENGRYFIDNVTPGGPYTITANASGYPLSTQNGIRLSLGQRLTVDLAMKFQTEEIVIVEQIDELQDKGRTGPSTTVNETKISRLPLQGRNFTDLVSTSPQASGSSLGGQNNRMNNIQIDGGANNDLFGLSGSGTPGGLANAKPLSIEAIKEFVVQIAPFDVRQGSFTGGLVNAITKSGTNEFHGSAYTYYQNKSLTRTDFCDAKGNCGMDDPNYNGFHTVQFGASVGGPIIQDKLHFFLSADLQDRSSAFGSPFNLTGNDATDKAATGFTTADVNRFAQILHDTYNVSGVGDASAPPIGNPDRNVFGKISWNINANNRAELSYNFVNASLDVLGRAPGASPLTGSGAAVPGGIANGWQLSNSGYSIANNTNTARVKVTSNFAGGTASNEFLGGVSIIHDERTLPQNLPLILVDVGKLGAGDSWLAAGGERFSQANVLDQTIFQVQDNVSFGLGDHRLTVGTSNEFFKFKNLFFDGSTGAWAFNSLDDLAAGKVAAYQHRIGTNPDITPGLSEFNVAQLGFYVQDEWAPLKNLTITPGVRVDLPILSSAYQNQTLLNNAALPIDTSAVPSSNLLWSPRLGFNWDVEGNADTIVRGGTGVFTGRPPYVWVSNAYLMNGITSIEINCPATAGGAVPPFTTNPNAQPVDCMGGTGMPTIPKNQGEVDYFDPSTKWPQNFTAALGADRKLPWGLVGSVDLMYTRDVDGWYTADQNIQVTGVSGEGRTLYGTFNPTNGRATISRIDPANLGGAIKVYNKSAARSWNASVGLTKRFGNMFELSVGYNYLDSQDLISLTSSRAISNYRFTPLDGTIQERNLTPSAFDRTHKITVTGTAGLPYGFEAGFMYVAQSGLPYTWVVNGDVNGDGFFDNDLVYVPAKQSDITLADPTQWDALNSFIDSQDCLKNARGGFLKRGACRNPWSNVVNLRAAWGMKTIGDQRFLVQLDVFNFLNIFNPEWGQFNQVTGNQAPDAKFLSVSGYDTTNNRPIYKFAAPAVIESPVYSPTSSRWRIQLGARYEF
jgi:outer membrane receptor protein involved in Fe transport